ncbi:MAG: TlpA family protein disulfide reductase [Burkholderiales bacterium]|nr:TlpA family protein disulfide reductase [Burkholderiales bacterium]
MRRTLAVVVATIAMAWAAVSAHACPCEVLEADGELSETQFVQLPRLTLVDGRTIDLAGGDGDAVAVLFWATWCPACRRELADADRFASMFRKRNVTLIGVVWISMLPHSTATSVRIRWAFPCR